MPLQSADMTQKSGDDYAARVYLSFEVAPERLGLGTRMDLGLARSLLGEKVPDAAVNYIWDNRHAVGTDFQAAFGHAPLRLTGIAIATDTDNTSEEARAGVRPDGFARQPCISTRNKDLNREHQTYPEFLAGHAGPDAAQPVAGGPDFPGADAARHQAGAPVPVGCRPCRRRA